LKDNKINKVVADLIGSHLPPNYTVFVGLGNIDRADDGAGLLISRALKKDFPHIAFSEEEKSVESFVFDFIEKPDIKKIVFIDAADLGADPGDVEVYSYTDIKKFVPSFSTHKVPIAFIFEWIKKSGKEPYLIGIQPKTLEFMGQISESCKKTVSLLTEVISLRLKNSINNDYL